MVIGNPHVSRTFTLMQWVSAESVSKMLFDQLFLPGRNLLTRLEGCSTNAQNFHPSSNIAIFFCCYYLFWVFQEKHKHDKTIWDQKRCNLINKLKESGRGEKDLFHNRLRAMFFLLSYFFEMYIAPLYCLVARYIGLAFYLWSKFFFNYFKINKKQEKREVMVVFIQTCPKSGSQRVWNILICV